MTKNLNNSTILKQNNKKLIYLRVLLIVVFLCLLFLSLFIGASSKVTIGRILRLDEEAILIMLSSRGPRTLAIIITASALSIAGLVMQAISRNKFISPSTSGTGDAALLGLLLSLIFLGNQTTIVKLVFSFVFAFLASLLFISLVQRIKFKDLIYVPLIGIMFGSVINAFTQFIGQALDINDVVIRFSQGSFTMITEKNVSLLLILVVPLIFVFLYATKFSIVSMGEDFAKNLGVNYRLVIIIGLMIISLISATTFVVVGPIPFIGLIIPNLLTAYYGDHVKKNLVDLMLFGSSFVLLNDIIARVRIFPYEVSLSLIMGVVGSLIFLILILRRVKNGKA